MHSLMVGIFDPACELLPPWMKELYRQCMAVGRGGVLSCVVDHILQEFNTQFLIRFRTYKTATPPQTPNKNIIKDDNLGLVSL